MEEETGDSSMAVVLHEVDNASNGVRFEHLSLILGV